MGGSCLGRGDGRTKAVLNSLGRDGRETIWELLEGLELHSGAVICVVAGVWVSFGGFRVSFG